MRSKYCHGCKYLWDKRCSHWRHAECDGTNSSLAILSTDIVGGPHNPLRLDACLEHDDKEKERDGETE